MNRVGDNLISILCLGAMLIGVLFSFVYPKGDRRREKSTIVFGVCADRDPAYAGAG